MARVRSTTPASWSFLPLIVFLVSLAATLAIWLLVRAHEHAHIRSVTRLMASAVRADLAVDVETWAEEQVRLAKLWEFDQPSREKWALFAQLYIEHHPGCEAIAWLDLENHEHWVVGPNGEPAGRIDIAKSQEAQRLLTQAKNSRAPAVSSVLHPAGGQLLHLTAVPIFRHEQFVGFVVASINVEKSLDDMLVDIKGLNFSVAIDESGHQVFALVGSSEDNRQWVQTADLPLPGGIRWQLRVWPTAEAMKEIKSNLPLFTLIFGVSFTLLLTLLTYIQARLKQEVVERGRVEAAMRASQARFAGILEISPEGVISTDEQQRINLFNQSAERIFGYSMDEVIGQPLDILIPEPFRAIHRHHFASFAASPEKNLLLSAHRLVFGRRKDGSEFPMAAALSKLDLGGERIFTVLCNDMTRQVRAEEELLRAHDELETRVLARTADLRKANVTLESEILERRAVEEEVRQLSGKIMRVQDEERRHLARELHDGAAQNLVSVTLNLHRLREVACHNEEEITRLNDCVHMVEQCTNELRSISYLLHPPMLEELGLARALRGYVEGFSKRSGITVVLNSPADLGPLDFELQLTVFRIVQETLSNILQHSHSASAFITLSLEGADLRIEIADQGCGIAEGRDGAGVGLAGMRERVRLLRGRISVNTGKTGTIITVVLPLAGGILPPREQPRQAGVNH